MDNDLRIQQLEKEVERLKEKDKYRKCPLCGGKSSLSTPSGVNDIHCWTCSGSGRVLRD